MRQESAKPKAVYAHADITSVHLTIADDVIYMQIYTAAKIARLPVALGRQ